jgi:UDP-N-acetylglucosamine 2-epimerase (non-hydrolysing)
VRDNPLCLIVAGARPNFMKIAPIIKELQRRAQHPGTPTLDWKLVHTGQHYDPNMSGVFFEELEIPAPDFSLNVGSGSHAVQTAQVMLTFEKLCASTKPDWVLVVGDVNSTMACALVCAKLRIKVVHVEAGLRSNDREMPEEINRLVTDSIADLLLTPSEDADQNLRREGVPDWRIGMVGNVMIDALVANLPKADMSSASRRFGITPGKFCYVTVHRPSNVDTKESLSRVMSSLSRLSSELPVIFPVHPRTMKMIGEFGIPVEQHSGPQLIEPLGYHDSLWMTKNARFVLTDSGGIQEESTFLRTPCLTLRRNTERPVTLKGTNRLTTLDRLDADVADILGGRFPIGEIPKFWDGRTSGRIVDAMLGFTLPEGQT